MPRGYRGSATHAAFSPDGSRIVTASLDKTARLWPNYPTSQSPIDCARCIVPRQLTDDERERFFLEPESPSEAGHEGRLRDCCPQVVDNLASADGLVWPVAVAFKENVDRCCPPRLAGVLAALTVAVADSVATAAIAAGVYLEQARSLGHFVGNGAAQHFSAHNYAACDHRQEHGVFDRRDAPRVGPKLSNVVSQAAHAGDLPDADSRPRKSPASEYYSMLPIRAAKMGDRAARAVNLRHACNRWRGG